MTVSQVGGTGTSGPQVASTSGSNSPSVTGTWGTGQVRTAGDLLVAAVTVYGTTSAVLGATPSGWKLASAVNANARAITAHYTKVAAGSDAAPAFSSTTAGTAADASIQVVLHEFTDTGGTPVLVSTGTVTGTTATTITAASDAVVPVSGCLAVASAICSLIPAASTTWTTPSGWTLAADQTASAPAQMASYYTSSAPTSGSAVSCLFTHRTCTQQSASILVLAPAGTTAQPYTVQHASATGSGVTTVTASFCAPAQAGDMLAAAITTPVNDATITSIKLGGSADNWAQVAHQTNVNDPTQYVWADPDCAGGSVAVAVVVSTSDSPAVDVYEVGGLGTSPVADVAALNGTTGTGAAWTSNATGTSTAADEWVLGVMGGYNNAGATITVTGPSSPWHNEPQLTPATALQQLSGYQIATSTGTFTYSGSSTMTSPNNVYTAQAVAFKSGTTTTPVSSSDTPGAMADAGERVSLSSADTLGTAADAGEAVHAALSSADTSAGATAGETIHVSSADVLGTAVDGGEHAAASLASADTLGTAVDAGETARLTSADAPGAVVDAGERTGVSSADTSTVTTAGEAVSVPVASADALGAMADAGSVHAALASADVMGTAVDGGEHVAAALSSSDSSPGTTAGETIHVSSADALGTVADGGEAVRTGVSSADALGTMADAGEHVAASLSGADAFGAMADAGEHVAASLSGADAFGAMVDTGSLVEHVSGTDTSHMTDAGEAVADHFTSADTLGTVADAGERVRVSSADTSAGATAGEVVRVVSADAFPALADAGEHVGTLVSDADSGRMVDSGFSYISSADTSTMAEAQQAGPVGTDTSTMTDLELSNWPSDSDASTMAETGYWSGTVADTDVFPAAADAGEVVGVQDVFPYPGGDSSVMTDTYNPGIGVYTYEPAWVIGAGGGFLVVYHGRVLWRGDRVERRGLELAQAVARGEKFGFAEDTDSCTASDEEQATVGVTVVVQPLIEVQLDILLAPEL